jgi:hypothetical protein
MHVNAMHSRSTSALKSLSSSFFIAKESAFDMLYSLSGE